MSDTPQASNWWQASDGKWYPPEQHPGATAAQPATPDPGTPPPFTAPPAAPGDPAGRPPGTVPPQPGQQPAGAPPEPAQRSGGRGKLVAAVLVALLLIAGGVVAYLVFSGDDDSDSSGEVDGSGDSGDKDIGSATAEKVDDGPIEFDTTYEDALEETRTEASYTLDVPAGAIMTLTVDNDESSTRGVFATFGSDGQRYADMRVEPGASESQTVIVGEEGAAEFQLDFTEGPAAFSFEVALEVQDDAGGGGDAGSDFDTAFALEAGQSVAAQLGGDDQTDHYTLELQPGTEFTFEASTDRSSERGVFFVVELDGDRLFAERVEPGSDTSVALLLSDSDEGTLEIIATEGPATYGFTADFTELNEGGESGDASAELADARTVDGAAAIEGSVGGRDQGDYYLFTVPSAALTLTATNAAESERGFFVTVEDESGSRAASFRVEPGAQTTESIEVTAGSQVRIVVTEGPASYSIAIS